MIIKKNVNLELYTTIHIGGTAERFYIPESVDELIELLEKLESNKQLYYFLSNGSNLLINNEKIYRHVIFLKKFNQELYIKEDGVYCGASVSIQQLINFINQRSMGGIEYLYSVPALVGGAVCMNAGRGKKYFQSIGDYVEYVDIYRNGKREQIKREACAFEYRNSSFKGKKGIIIGVQFRFPEKNIEESQNLKEARMKYSKSCQDVRYANFGSVFSVANSKIMKIFQIFRIGYKEGVRFSGKTSNWLINTGKGNFRQVMILIKRTELIHKIFKKPIEREIIIWD